MLCSQSHAKYSTSVPSSFTSSMCWNSLLVLNHHITNLTFTKVSLRRRECWNWKLLLWICYSHQLNYRGIRSIFKETFLSGQELEPWFYISPLTPFPSKGRYKPQNSKHILSRKFLNSYCKFKHTKWILKNIMFLHRWEDFS